MKRTKIFALVLALCMVVGLMAGCGATPAASAPAAPAEGSAAAPAAPAEADSAPAAAGSAAAPAADKEITVGVSVATATNNPHIVMVVDSLCQALEAQGWKVDMQDADNDSGKQSTQFDTLVTKNVDLIIYWANDAQAAIADCKKAADAGIPVISYFADCAEEAHQYIEAYVGADQLVIANAVGEYAAEVLGGKGNVAIINGKEGKTDFVLRSEGFTKVMNEKGITVLAEEYCDSDRTQAQSIMENYLTTYPELDLVFTCSDDFGYGALNALEAAGRAGEVKIVSIDGLHEVLQAIKDGKWDLTIYQTPQMMADKAVEVAKKVLAGEKIDEYNQNTDYYPVTAENVDEYLNK